MDRNLILELIRVTEPAAIAAARLVGCGDRHKADQVAVDAMRKAFDEVDIDGTVVIGEGERDEAPMLYIGEKVGKRAPNSTKVDIAVDPLEGTNLCATGAANAISVAAIAMTGNFLHAPDTYMDKIAVGAGLKGVVDLDRSPTENLHRLAEAKGVKVSDLTAIILERDRHKTLIDEVRKAGARIKLIGDGDVSAAIATATPDSGVDILFGIGGAPEGVLAAAALRCIDGDIQGRLKPRNPEEIERARKMGIKDINRKYQIDELARGDVLFAATGVTSGDSLRGVRFFKNGCRTQSVVMRSETGTVRTIDAIHRFDKRQPLA